MISSNKIPSGNSMAMISPTSLPNAAPREKIKEGKVLQDPSSLFSMFSC
jgi:hypothetical protein